VSDTAHLRFINELQYRLSRVVDQLLCEDSARPADDVVVRMLLSRVPTNGRALGVQCLSRVLQGFDRQDTTVLLNQ